LRVKKKTPTYEVEILEDPVNIGGLQGRPGDYILKGTDGSKAVMPREDLMRDYVPHDLHAQGGIWGNQEPRWDDDTLVPGVMPERDHRDQEVLDVSPE